MLCVLQGVQQTVSRLPYDASLTQVERQVVEAIKKVSRAFNNRRPEVICVAYEHDPRYSHVPEVAARRAAASQQQPSTATAGQARPNSSSRSPRVTDALSSGREHSVRDDAPTNGAPRPKLRTRALGVLKGALMPQPAVAAAAGVADEPSSSAEQSDDESGGSVGDSNRVNATGTRRGRSRKTAVMSSGSPPLQVVPSEVLEQRRLANPRENPNGENDMDYG